MGEVLVLFKWIVEVRDDIGDDNQAALWRHVV